jgi:hypothetical protein
LVAAAGLALHIGAWFTAAIVIARDLHPPPLQSAVVLALSALLLRIGELTSRRCPCVHSPCCRNVALELVAILRVVVAVTRETVAGELVIERHHDHRHGKDGQRGRRCADAPPAFALALYLGWIVIYIVGLGMSIVSDPYSSHIALGTLTEMYYFDRRLVHPLLSWNGFAEVGMASLAVGVFSMRCRRSCS